jgi:hypothetical protein
MAINLFARAWKILGSDRVEYFPIGSTLLIGIAGDEITKCHVIWQDGKGQSWCISELPLGENGAHELPVTVRSAQMSVIRQVTLTLDKDTHLQGSLTDQYGYDGPVGTFTAEANHGQEVLDASRLEERIAV